VTADAHTAWSSNDRDHDPVRDLPSQSPPSDSSIDDPVNDTALGPGHGDLQS